MFRTFANSLIVTLVIAGSLSSVAADEPLADASPGSVTFGNSELQRRLQNFSGAASEVDYSAAAETQDSATDDAFQAAEAVDNASTAVPEIRIVTSDASGETADHPTGFARVATNDSQRGTEVFTPGSRSVQPSTNENTAAPGTSIDSSNRASAGALWNADGDDSGIVQAAATVPDWGAAISSDIELVNRWRKFEEGKGTHPNMGMRQHYAEKMNMLEGLLRFPTAL